MVKPQSGGVLYHQMPQALSEVDYATRRHSLGEQASRSLMKDGSMAASPSIIRGYAD